MNETGTFPLSFPFKRIYRESAGSLASTPFLVSAMFTEGYLEHADRLARSCEKHGLQYILYEVPEIHQSISPQGSANPSFTKANFIHFLLETHQTPILYIDIDCEVVDAPNRIEALVHDGYDFAIYNWLADEHTESYVPVEISLKVDDKMQTFTDRFYHFSHSIDDYSVDQMICSGAVQLYNDSAPAKALLKNWHKAILAHPHTEDDACLDFVFNNQPSDDTGLKFAWLEKAYARYGWWIYEKPVINHPDIPYRGNAFQEIQDRPGAKRVYMERTQPRVVEYYFPKDQLIDTETCMLIKVQDGAFASWQPLTRKLWIQDKN